MRSRPDDAWRRLLVAGVFAFGACGSPEPPPAAEGEPAATMTAAGSGSDSALAAALDAGERQAIDLLPPGAGNELVVGTCLVCHDPAIIQQQRKDREAWTRSIRRMVEWGAPLSAEQQEVVVDYLAENFGPAPATTP